MAQVAIRRRLQPRLLASSPPTRTHICGASLACISGLNPEGERLWRSGGTEQEGPASVIPERGGELAPAECSPDGDGSEFYLGRREACSAADHAQGAAKQPACHALHLAVQLRAGTTRPSKQRGPIVAGARRPPRVVWSRPTPRRRANCVPPAAAEKWWDYSVSGVEDGDQPARARLCRQSRRQRAW